MDGLHADVPVVGHVGGTSAMMVRSGGRIHVVGATCPHYGGPLAEGLVADGVVHCPWHHAAFSLESGRCVNPPALDGISCWPVEVRDGKAFALEGAASVTPPAPLRRQPRDARAPIDSVVVIGGGAAGFSAVQTLRNEGFEGRVTMVTAERTPPVDRPNLSKDYLAGNAPEDWIPLRPHAWYAENAIHLQTRCTAERIDVRRRLVQLDDGQSLPYDALILATGASPVRLPLGDAPVLYLRTLDDSRRIAARATPGRRGVVIGASFIGLEVAASLRKRDMDVTVVAPESLPLERVVGRELATAVLAIHEANGVRFRLGRSVVGATADAVHLDDGTHVPADLIVAGVGVRPNLQLAEGAGLAVDRGIVVDEFLETSVPAIFAAGDVARFPAPDVGAGVRIEHWVVAQQQGRTAARNALGARERHTAVPFFWSAHYGMTISYVGHSERPDHIRIDGDPARHDCTVRYVERGRVCAVATIGRDRESLKAAVLLAAASPDDAGLVGSG